MADSYENQNSLHGMGESIFSQIRSEQKDYMFNWISIVPGYPFNTYYTIKRIHLYLNSKYLADGGVYASPNTSTGSYEPNADDRIFFNVVIPPCEVAMRMLNIDTKNIRLWPMNPKSQFSTYLLEKELKVWLKGNKFAKVLNQLAEEAPRYGSVVLEKTVDGADVVDLRRLILDPTVQNIGDSRFVTTITYMTPTQLREAKGWDAKAVEDAIARYQTYNTQEPYEDQYVNVNLMRSTPYIKVYKRYGEVPAEWLNSNLKGTKEGAKMVRALFIVAGPDWMAKNAEGNSTQDMGCILFSSKWQKKWPFKDFHYMKTRGRWLGIGIVEMLFDVQERVNEMKNQKRVAMQISSLHLFQTKDKSIVRNVLTDLQSGDLILAGKDGGIEPISTEERNLPAFKDEEESYSAQADKLSFAYEAIRGDTSDASQSTLGQTQIAVAQGTSVFAFKKENLSLFIQDFFNDLVMPQLMKDLTPEHVMRFTGSAQELQKLDQAAAEIHANDYVKSEILSGRFPKKEDFEAAKQQALSAYQKLGENRFIKMKDSFYDDAEFEFDFLVTNEQADPSKMAANIQSVLGEMASLQPMLSDPRVKLLFAKLYEQLGISPAEFELADQQAQQMQPGISAPKQLQGNVQQPQ